MKIYLVRHGETAKNISGLTHAKGDIEHLNSRGKEQAHFLAKSLLGLKIAKIYSSEETRAVETAEILAETLDVEYEAIGALHERNMGDLNGKPWSGIEPILNKMTIEDRLMESLRAISGRHRNESIAVVTHAGAIRGIMPKIKNEPLESSFKYDLQNTSVTELEYNNAKFRVIRENDFSHLTALRL